MAKRLIPQNTKDVLEIVRAAVNDKKSVEIIGAGTKRGWGRPNEISDLMNISTLSGISLYEPKELVLTAKAGTPINNIIQTLSQNHQQIAFEPPDFSSLYGGEKNHGTLGGIIATNLSGPRRIQSGAARDYCLGFEAISGRGEKFKSGGRVVKNVTGFDLSKLLTGSFGTLAVMTSVTIKVSPSPDKTRTVLVYGLDDRMAIQALSETLQSSFEVNAAAYMPGDIATNSSVSYVAAPGLSVAAVRLQGPGPSVDARCQAIRNLWQSYGEVEELHSHNSFGLWHEIRDVDPLLNNKQDQIWRLSVAPSEGANVVARVRNKIQSKAYFDWGGGLIWLAADGDLMGVGKILRSAIGSGGGHATLLRASSELRLESSVFQPQEPKVSCLTKSIKENFDPERVLNPGRMYEGI